MTKKKIIVLLGFVATIVFSSCSSDDDHSSPASQLPKMPNVSLNYRASTQAVTLARDVESEGAVVSKKKGVSWINNLYLAGNVIHFDVEENWNTTSGHRFDTLEVSVKGTVIGTICVTQARNPFSSTRLPWATSDALYIYEPISSFELGGLELTKRVYNLEKTTKGKDSYKNYPAFAFCIEMNHDPENNMEWYLPSLSELESYANGDSFSGTPLARHNYWWSSTDDGYNGGAYNLYSGSIASRGAVSKYDQWWVVAFRNRRIEE